MGLSVTKIFTITKEYALLKLREWAMNYLYTGKIEMKDNVYTLTYFIGQKEYKAVFKGKRGPNKITKILNKNDEDITDRILAYMGPTHNFHNIPTSPKMLNLDECRFIHINGNVSRFCGDETIVIPC